MYGATRFLVDRGKSSHLLLAIHPRSCRATQALDLRTVCSRAHLFTWLLTWSTLQRMAGSLCTLCTLYAVSLFAETASQLGKEPCTLLWPLSTWRAGQITTHGGTWILVAGRLAQLGGISRQGRHGASHFHQAKHSSCQAASRQHHSARSPEPAQCSIPNSRVDHPASWPLQNSRQVQGPAGICGLGLGHVSALPSHASG